jgi:hypothetical protein
MNKDNFECVNKTSQDGIKNCDTFGSDISVWTVIIENVMHIGSSEKIWPVCQIYVNTLTGHCNCKMLYTHKISFYTNSFDLFEYISCTIATFHKKNQHTTSSDCITAANFVIHSVAEIRHLFRNSAKKCRLYHQESERGLFMVVLTVAYSYCFPFWTALWKRRNWNIYRSVIDSFLWPQSTVSDRGITANWVCLGMGRWIKYLDLRCLA